MVDLHRCPWLDDVRRLCASLAAGDAASAALRGLLDAGEVRALVTRCEQMLGSPVLPEMYPYRCVPWPLI
ncbi:MAG: hypothetical protein WD734_00045 [Dehalococcoidia bacterium]